MNDPMAIQTTSTGFLLAFKKAIFSQSMIMKLLYAPERGLLTHNYIY